MDLAAVTIMNLAPGKRTSTTDSSTKFIAGARVNTRVVGESIALHRGDADATGAGCAGLSPLHLFSTQA